MVNRIKLINFKCFSNSEIDLKDLTVFTGANATGKSSVIQALILAEYTNRQGQNFAGSWDKVLLDINGIFGFQVGAPNALVSQNPIDVEEDRYDFCIELQEGEEKFIYEYNIDMAHPLKLCVAKGTLKTSENVQYLNAERVGPRVSNPAGAGDGITFDGENAAYLVELGDRTDRKISDHLKMHLDESGKFSHYVEEWMGAILGNLQLDIRTDFNKATTELRIKNSLVDTGIVPTLTGFGISYVFPVVVAGLWATAEEKATLILENPEAHLHPYAQSNLGKFLALLASCGVQVIVETHSEHIIDGARYQMAKLGISDKAIINYMENRGENIDIHSISVSDKGELSSWPKGFFDQKQLDLRDIMMLRRKNV